MPSSHVLPPAYSYLPQDAGRDKPVISPMGRCLFSVRSGTLDVDGLRGSRPCPAPRHCLDHPGSTHHRLPSRAGSPVPRLDPCPSASAYCLQLRPMLHASLPSRRWQVVPTLRLQGLAESNLLTHVAGLIAQKLSPRARTAVFSWLAVTPALAVAFVVWMLSPEDDPSLTAEGLWRARGFLSLALFALIAFAVRATIPAQSVKPAPPAVGPPVCLRCAATLVSHADGMSCIQCGHKP